MASTTRISVDETTESTLPSAEHPQSAKSLDEFAKLTLLLRLAVLLRNGNGDASIPRFAENVTAGSSEGSLSPSDESDLAMLDAISAILIQDTEVVASCYQSTSNAVTVVFGGDGTDQQHIVADDTDLDFPTEGSGRLNSREKQYPGNGNPHNLRLVSGNDLWLEIKTKDEDGAFDFAVEITKDRQISMADHATTVCSYLNDYKDHPELRADYSLKFFDYLLSVCWRKMLRRLTAWPGLGFIYLLEDHMSFLENNIKTFAWNTVGSSRGPGDATLAELLIANPSIITSLKKFSPPRLEIKSFETLMSEVHSGGAFYTKDTAMEFHRFLLAALTVLARALVRMHRDYADLKRDKQPGFAVHFAFIKMHTRLLLYILSSSAFKTHMHVCALREGAKVLTPVYRDREMYQKSVGSSIGLEMHDTLPIVTDGLNDRDQVSELREEPNVPALIKWAKNFVFQFLGKRVLEHRCCDLYKCGAGPVKISLLAVDSSRYQVPSWSQFEDVIDHAIAADSRCPLNTTTAVEVLCTRVSSFRRHPGQHGVGGTIRLFEGIMPGNQTVKGINFYLVGVHCEAVLAALAISNQDDVILKGDRELSRVCADLQSDLISVSTLCCPVCWHLLETLRNQKPSQWRFAVRSPHSNIFPVDLPTFLPQDVKQKMIEIFQGLLRTELSKLTSASHRQLIGGKVKKDNNYDDVLLS